MGGELVGSTKMKMSFLNFRFISDKFFIFWFLSSFWHQGTINQLIEKIGKVNTKRIIRNLTHDHDKNSCKFYIIYK